MEKQIEILNIQLSAERSVKDALVNALADANLALAAARKEVTYLHAKLNDVAPLEPAPKP